MSADASPTLPFDPAPEQHPRRRRRVWPWLVVLAIVVALVVGAWIAAESIARGIVTGGVRTLVASQVQVADGGSIDVDVPGAVLPQLISGTIDEITITAPGVTVGPITGDVSVTANGVPIRGDAAARGGTATVHLDQDELRALLREIDGFPADTVGLASPNVTASSELSLFGVSVPIGIALSPGAADGDLTLTPASFQAGGVDLDADAVRERFGGLADAVLRDWSLCIADQLPAALTLTGVSVDDANEVVATFDVDGAVVVDRTLLANGTCG
jgi:hypothetical protein